MRKSLGLLVLLLGTGGLTWYATKKNAVVIQDHVTKGADAIVASGGNGLQVKVQGRDIDLTGQVASEAEKEEILAQLNAVDGRRVVRDETSLLEIADPFELTADKAEGGTTYAGVVPSEEDRGRLAAAIGDAAKDLKLSRGAPEGWTDSVEAGLAGLDMLETGMLKVSNTTLTLTGMAKSPAERDAATAKVGNLNAAFTTDVKIDVMDDGNPVSLMVDASKDSGITAASGKLPNDVELATLGGAFGADIPEAEMVLSELPSPVAGWGDAAGQSLQALALLDNGKLRIENTDISLTGSASPEAKEKAEAMMNGLPEGFTQKTVINSTDDGAPFSAKVVYDGAAATITGKVPSDMDSASVSRMLEADANTDGVVQAVIKDDSGTWNGVLESGMKALGMLENGELTVYDRDVMLTGMAKSPTERDEATALLAAVPDGYTQKAEINVLDDGNPPAYTLDYAMGETAQMAGKLPQGMEVSAVAGALGLGEISGEPISGLTGESETDMQRMGVLKGKMPEIKTMKITRNDAEFKVEIQTIDGVNAAEMQAALESAMGAGAVVMVKGTDMPKQSNCNSEGLDVMKNNPVNFKTGSARIDDKSEQSIDAIAAFVLQCMKDGSGKVELGGHTDSEGADEDNMKLSQMRAEAVRNLLIQRGVDEDKIIAKGYGETSPIADNNTAEGRAANRRTTLEFSQ